MKRYEHCKVLNRMISAPDGEWVKYEDVKKLKELNREMVEALTMVYKRYHNDMSIYDLTQVYDAIAKAEGREPIIKEEGE